VYLCVCVCACERERMCAMCEPQRSVSMNEFFCEGSEMLGEIWMPVPSERRMRRSHTR